MDAVEECDLGATNEYSMLMHKVLIILRDSLLLMKRLDIYVVVCLQGFLSFSLHSTSFQAQ